MADGNRISFSELKVWNECSYKHHLVYKQGLKGFIGNEYTAFGTAIHAVCEEKIQGNETPAHQIFDSSFLQELTSLKDQGVPLREDLVKEMRSQSKPLCELAIPEINKYFDKYELVSVEEKLLEEITEFDSDGKKFKGFIDLVLKTDDGKYHIIDWKTCSWGWNMKKRSDPMVTYQLTYYKNYFCKKHNIDPSMVETYFALLKRTAKKENVEIFRVTSGAKKINNSLKLLEKAVININKDVTVKNRLSCKNCEFYKTEHCR